MLLFEAVALMRLVGDVASDRKGLTIALLVGALSFGLPQGFVVGLIVGMGVYYWWGRRQSRGRRDERSDTADPASLSEPRRELAVGKLAPGSVIDDSAV